MTVRWAFIGAGRHAELWTLPAVLAADGAELIGVCGQHPDKARAFADRYGIPQAYASVEDLVSDPRVDAVYVSTPNSLHAPHSLAALRAGKHVLCEKPMAASIGEAREMVDAAGSTGVQLGVGFHLRHHQLVQEARDQISSGRVGRVLYVSAQFNLTSSAPPRLNLPHSAWKSDPAQMGGAGALMGLGVHVIDAVRYLVGDEVARLSASASGMTPERPLENFAQVLLEFDGGTQAHLVYGGQFTLSINDIWIYGDRGRVGLKDVVDVQTHGTLEITQPDGPAGRREERHQPALVDHYRRQFEDFGRSISDGSQFGASGVDGLRSVEITRAIIESQTSGRRVDVERTSLEPVPA